LPPDWMTSSTTRSDAPSASSRHWISHRLIPARSAIEPPGDQKRKGGPRQKETFQEIIYKSEGYRSIDCNRLICALINVKLLLLGTLTLQKREKLSK
jgi:hypothetical protein